MTENDLFGRARKSRREYVTALKIAASDAAKGETEDSPGQIDGWIQHLWENDPDLFEQLVRIQKETIDRLTKINDNIDSGKEITNSDRAFIDQLKRDIHGFTTLSEE